MIPKHNDDLWNAIRAYATACGGTPHGEPNAERDEGPARAAVLEIQLIVHAIEELAWQVPVRTPADPSRAPKVMWLPEASIVAIQEGRYEDAVRAMKPIDLLAMLDRENARPRMLVATMRPSTADLLEQVASGVAETERRAREIADLARANDGLADIASKAHAVAVLERVAFAIFVHAQLGESRPKIDSPFASTLPRKPATQQQTLQWMGAWLDLSQEEREPWRAIAREALFGNDGPVAGVARAQG